jgi:hypothetical protein
MSEFLTRVQALVRQGEVHLSLHGFRELAADDIILDNIIGSIENAVLIEEYPAFAKRAMCPRSAMRPRKAAGSCPVVHRKPADNSGDADSRLSTIT